MTRNNSKPQLLWGKIPLKKSQTSRRIVLNGCLTATKVISFLYFLVTLNLVHLFDSITLALDPVCLS